jgi:hypothetical protein
MIDGVSRHVGRYVLYFGGFKKIFVVTKDMTNREDLKSADQNQIIDHRSMMMDDG